jgi:GNAT superfamily N-acetyltransferase
MQRIQAPLRSYLNGSRNPAKAATETHRGCAVICDIDSRVVGYALLISFWSIELGGEICVVNELFIAPFYRSRGFATMLFERLAGAPWCWR